MKRILLLTALAGTLAGAALAQTAAPAVHDRARVQAGSYKVDPNHTQITFGVSHMGFSEYRGRFSGVDGTLQIDPNHIATAKLDVSVPVASVSTTSDKLDGELRSADWLDAGQFPQMRFRSVRVTPMGAGRARIDGELTLHGQTRPVTLQARFMGAGTDPLAKVYTVGFEATGTLNRSAFGVKTYLPLIGDEISLTIAGAFQKAG